ncbi:hypothetical protein B0A49_12205, partial [Cryomyces minteri]
QAKAATTTANTPPAGATTELPAAFTVADAEAALAVAEEAALAVVAERALEDEAVVAAAAEPEAELDADAEALAEEPVADAVLEELGYLRQDSFSGGDAGVNDAAMTVSIASPHALPSTHFWAAQLDVATEAADVAVCAAAKPTEVRRTAAEKRMVDRMYARVFQ